jgi:hypothetical protein
MRSPDSIIVQSEPVPQRLSALQKRVQNPAELP